MNFFEKSGDQMRYVGSWEDDEVRALKAMLAAHQAPGVEPGLPAFNLKLFLVS